MAIGKTGELLVGPDDIADVDQALAKFGRGNFAFRKIGERTLGRLTSSGTFVKMFWLSLIRAFMAS